MATKFEKYFKKSLLNEADVAPDALAPTDAEALDASIEDPAAKKGLKNELSAVSAGASAVNSNTQQLLDTAQQYAEELKAILARVVAIHKDFTTGTLAQLGLDVKTNVLTGIRSDLGKMIEAIGGGADEAIIKQASDKVEATKM